MLVFDSIQQQVLKNTKLEDLDKNDERSQKKSLLNSARKSNVSPAKEAKETKGEESPVEETSPESPFQRMSTLKV